MPIDSSGDRHISRIITQKIWVISVTWIQWADWDQRSRFDEQKNAIQKI